MQLLLFFLLLLFLLYVYIHIAPSTRYARRHIPAYTGLVNILYIVSMIEAVQDSIGPSWFLLGKQSSAT